MNRINRMLILFLITSFFVIGTDIESIPAFGAELPVQTYISTWPGNYYYLDDDTIEIEVSIWDENGQSVETGIISVNDLNSTSEALFPVSSQTTIVSLIADSNGIIGPHVFELTYNDPTETYSEVINTIDIMIGNDINPGATGTTIEVDYPSYSVAKGQEISVTGNLTSDHPAIPYFFIDPNTAYISLEANIEGNWKIIDVDYLSSGIITSYDFDFLAIFPYWLATGVINSRYIFSGTVESGLAASSTSFIINLLSSQKSLVTFPHNDTIERSNVTENHNLVMDIQVPGFDGEPVEIDVELLTSEDTLIKKLIDGQQIINYNSQLSIKFANDIPVGSYVLSSKLIDSSTDIVLASDNHTINLIDDLLIDNFFWNVSNQIVSPGQSIQGHLVSREEDTFIGTQSDLNIEIQGEVLFNGTSNINGYIDFTATIPGTLTSGYYDVRFTTSSLPSSYYKSVIKVLQVVIPEDTSILHQESINLIRNKTGWFNATVIDEKSIPVESGLLSLTLDGTLLYESAGGTSNYTYVVPKNANRGINIFKWTYTGDGYYSDSFQNVPVAIFSKPSFVNLSSSISELIPGGSLELKGRLIEETNDPVIGQNVLVTQRDNWGIETQFTLLTDDDGWFTIDFNPDIDDVGTYFFIVEFQGDSSYYYLPISGLVIFEVSVSPPISLQVNGLVVAGENSALVFQGKPNQNIDLEILQADIWTELAIIPLNSEGSYQYDWIPDNNLKGDVLLKATYSDGQGQSIFTINVKVRPQLNLEIFDSLFFTNQEIIIEVSSNEIHDIWLDNELWESDLSSGSRQFSIIFDLPGDHIIEVSSTGNDIVDVSISQTIQVRENYTITADFPERVQKGVTFHLEILVENEVEPLEGFIVELFLDETLIATSVTSQLGIASIDTSLINGQHNLKTVINPLNDTIHLSKEINLGTVTVYTVPSVKIQETKPVKGKSVDIQILVTDEANPVVNETIDLYLENLSGDKRYFIGNSLTNNEGIATITWNVTEDSGDYYLKAENVGNQFLKSIVTSKTVHILESGPIITLASITEINRDQNIFSITAIVDFPSGSGNLYLYSADKVEIKELQNEGEIWITSIQLEKGTHDFWLKAVDNQSLEAWYNLESVQALTDLSTEPQTGGTGGTDDNRMQDTIRDTLISMILMIPVTAVVAFKKRRGIKKGGNS